MIPWFGQPWWLLLFPALVWWFWRRGRAAPSAALAFSSTVLLAPLRGPGIGGPGRILRRLRFVIMGLFIIGLARPRLPEGERPDPNKGIDIMLVCDGSGSMNEKDFTIGGKSITRREALVTAIAQFVDARTDDRIGMLAFGKESYLLSPLTTDGNWIKQVYGLTGPIKDGGTAIGDGIIAGVNKIQENPKRSKVMILVTDGENNAGRDPREAAEYARRKDVRIYALDIVDPRRIRAAEAAQSPLAKVATTTGGQYFQASNTEALVQIYRQIDLMEKHDFDSRRHMLFRELFLWVVIPGALLLAFERIAASTFWLRVP
jgi:Ca-activated chloride channel family protein